MTNILLTLATFCSVSMPAKSFPMQIEMKKICIKQYVKCVSVVQRADKQITDEMALMRCITERPKR